MMISIDLWGTLIKSSPTFQIRKLKLFNEYFDDSDAHILRMIHETKIQLNSIIEVTGWQPELMIIWTLLFSKLKLRTGKTVNWNLISEFNERYQDLVYNDPPIDYSDITAEYVKKLSELGDLRISSNTMFIEGDTLYNILERRYGALLTICAKFSDIERVAKPHLLMFNSTYHIGDNMRTDYVGAKAAGSIPIIINSNDRTIKDAYDIICKDR